MTGATQHQRQPANDNRRRTKTLQTNNTAAAQGTDNEEYKKMDPEMSYVFVFFFITY
jgi:hypothetical protein